MPQLLMPLQSYQLSPDVWKFGDRVPRRLGLPAIHLGDDVLAEAGTPVQAIGAGEVVLARTLPGSEQHRSWGGVVIIRHEGHEFCSIYGHLQNLQVSAGARAAGGQELGEVAGSYTPENGWWKQPHLHFAIYVGPWQGEVLPGYWRPERFWQTRRIWWHEPQRFIEEYNRSQVG